MAYLPTRATITLAEAADRVSGKLHGDGSRSISGICALNEPLPGCIAFSRGSQLKAHVKNIEQAGVVAVLSDPSAGDFLSDSSVAAIFTPVPYDALLKLLPIFYREYLPDPGISPRADVHPTAIVAATAHVGPFCAVGEGAQIGERAVLHPNVVIYPYTQIGARTVIHSGAVIREGVIIGSDCVVHCGAIIGADGFGYVPKPNGGIAKVPQIGSVYVDSDAEIGANTCVDRATFGTTRVGKSSKLDNLVQVGHNVRLGNAVLVCGQAGIAGSATLADGVVLGAQSGVGNHIEIGPRIRVAAKGGVVGSLTTPGDYASFPAIPARDWRRREATISRLVELLPALRKITKEHDK